jgi:hypothetical protein
MFFVQRYDSHVRRTCTLANAMSTFDSLQGLWHGTPVHRRWAPGLRFPHSGWPYTVVFALLVTPVAPRWSSCGQQYKVLSKGR